MLKITTLTYTLPLVVAVCSTTWTNVACALPIATFSTSLGSFQVELRSDVAPLTVQNFVNYVDSGAYNNTIIHRSIANFVVQGGGYSDAGAPFLPSTPPTHISQNAPVQNEFHLSNVAGTLAMAKLGGNPNSATTEWFFNLADNSSNLDNQNGGFTVFGDVLGSGMSIINAMVGVPAYNISSVWGNSFQNIPLQNFNIQTAKQITTDNLIVINSVTVAAPEPATAVMLFSGAGLAGASLWLNRRRRALEARSSQCRASKNLAGLSSRG
ncbi:MAG: peptidylprolyl isomerase [Singulisphaera sp.]